MAESGDARAKLVWDTMIYQICKQIGAMAAVLEGSVDGILLTGGFMRFNDIIQGIEKRCSWIAPISVYPGEMEQEALAYAVLDVLRGNTAARHIPANRYGKASVFNLLCCCLLLPVLSFRSHAHSTKRISYRFDNIENILLLHYVSGTLNRDISDRYVKEAD